MSLTLLKFTFLTEVGFTVVDITEADLTGVGGGRVVRWCWVSFQCRGVLFIWSRVGQGPTALAVGVGGGC